MKECYLLACAWFAKMKAGLDFQQNKLCIQFKSGFVERLTTQDLRKLGKFRKISKSVEDRVWCPVSPPKTRPWSQQLKFTMRQISRGFDPFQFRIISLLCPINFIRGSIWNMVFNPLMPGGNKKVAHTKTNHEALKG